MFSVHLEVQIITATVFPGRMFEFYFRMVDRFKKRITAVAVFTSGR